MDIGDRINNRYKIKNILGAGGMAQVYLARDLILERDVAVKVLAYNFQNDEESLRRFKREALSSTELVHPNIVNIYDVEEDGHPYIVMEYVKGMDLKEYILNNHPIPYRKTLTIMEQVLDAIQYAHENHIIHRDIKPQNILLDEKENVKITDFGIAVALSHNSITQTNSLLGSVHYLSPEQARGSLVTRKSDIYSLGIVLFEMLTGDVPFNGESAVSIALKHFQNPLPSIKKIDSRIPQPLENVVMKATAKDPNQRYESVEEMREDLRTSLSMERSGEEPFVPKDINEDATKILTPVSPVAAKNENPKNPVQETPEEVEEKPVVNEKKRKWPWVLVFFLLLFAAAFFFLASGPTEVEIPDVEGETLSAAQIRLEELNLLLGEVIEVADDEYEDGIVVDSNPEAGFTVQEEDEVDLYVSTGKAEYELENYEGRPYEEVRAQLTELGFTVERVDESSEEIASGNIISQNIEPGEEVVPDETTVTFEVSTGPAGFLFRDLRGYSRVGVDDYIEEHGLNITIENTPSDEVPEGQVISQEPEAGTTLYQGSHVTVIFSTGPEEAQLEEFSHLVTIPYEPAGEQTEAEREGGSAEEPPAETNEENDAGERVANRVQIYISDAERTMDEPAHDFEMTEQTQILLNFTVEEGETAAYRVVRDGEVIEETEVRAEEEN